jgi:hypothetical protein
VHEHHADDAKTDDFPCGCRGNGGKRNRFFRGKHMNAESFALEQRYLVGRRRLVNRAVLGWGVVHGFAISAPRDKEPRGARDVGRGLGIDPDGREVHLTGPVTITAANTFLLVAGRPRPVERLAPGLYVLSIHYAERGVEDARVTDDCGCGEPEKQFVCEAAVFSLEMSKDGVCPCAQEDCRPCRCKKEGERSPCCGHGRRGCACLCEWVADGPEDCPPELCEWNGYWINPGGGIRLACVEVERGEESEKPRRCEPIRFEVTDDCGPRRIVKGNDLLYDLVRGCDLTRISWISWNDWHRRPKRVEWSEFAGKFLGGPHWDAGEPVKTEFVVRFSGPVAAASFGRGAIVITVIAIDQSTGWELVRRVPIVSLDTTPAADPKQMPDGMTDQVRVHIAGDWAHDELEPGRSWLSDREFTVEIAVRGSFIRDCREQAVDGDTDPHQEDGVPSGNGTAGGTFVSTFRVAPKPGAGAAS